MDLGELADGIRRRQDLLRERAKGMRNMVRKVGRRPINLSVCAVDGGLLAHRMHGVDIVLSRAVGVNFVYEDSRLISSSHHPSRHPAPVVEARSALDEHEANVFRSLVRLKHELSCAGESLEKFSPQMLLLDGSLLPLPSDVPSDGSALRPLYDEVLGLYGELYSKDCLFCGVIKDSRAKRLSKDSTDSMLCDHLLGQGERTAHMGYYESKPPRDLAALGNKVNFFYIKPSEHDLPLRVEVIGDVEKAAELICSLSAISRHFAYPAALVEADMCAALDPIELQPIEERLRSKAGLRPLRRDQRPFR